MKRMAAQRVQRHAQAILQPTGENGRATLQARNDGLAAAKVAIKVARNDFDERPSKPMTSTQLETGSALP